MKYSTNYKNNDIEVKPAETEDWKGKETATIFNNYENAVQALSFAKESIDNNEIPQERVKWFGIF